MSDNNSNHKWRNPFHRFSHSKESKQPPKEYLCPITSSLMADPAVVSSGETFERISAQICRNLGYSPILEDGSRPDFSAIIPNLAMRTTIINWCDKFGIQHPSVPDYSSIERIVRTAMAGRVSESELIENVADNHPVIFSHAVSELNPRINDLYANFSGDESDGFPVSLETPLPLRTRPACYSFTSPEVVQNETVNGRNIVRSDLDSSDLNSSSSSDGSDGFPAKNLHAPLSRRTRPVRHSFSSPEIVENEAGNCRNVLRSDSDSSELHSSSSTGSDVFPVSLHPPLPLKPPPAFYSYSSSEIIENETANRNSLRSDSDFSDFNSSSSSGSDVFPVSLHPPLPLKPPPALNSYSSSEIMENETANRRNIHRSDSDSSSDEELVEKLNSTEIFEQEEAVISLRKITKSKEELRNSLCTPAILASLRSLIVSRYAVVQTNAIAALVNLSIEKSNKLKIVRSGLVPFIIDVLKGGCNESQEHAAGALFSLSLDDENKMAIGVLGALPPLLHALRSESERTRSDSGLALYHLTLIQSNRVKVVKLGAVAPLLAMAKAADLAKRVLLILCNLGVCAEGRSAMLDANAVMILVEILRRREVESAAVRENCVAALFALSRGSLRFKGLAKVAGASEVLREVEERGTERAREKARKILEMMKRTETTEEKAAATNEIKWDRNFNSDEFNRKTVIGTGGGAGSWKSC